MHLNTFRGAVADGQAVGAADVVGDGGVEAVAAHAHGVLGHHAAEREDGDFGGAAANVHYHVAGRGCDGNAGADGRGHRFADDVGGTGAGRQRGVGDGAAFGGGGAGRHAHHHVGPRQPKPARHFGDIVPDHGAGDAVVGDNAVAQRMRGLDGVRGAAEHALGLGADGHDLVVVVDGHHAGFVDHDAALGHINQDVGSAEINGDSLREHATSIP